KKNRLKMAVVSDGRRAVTKYRVMERFKANCYTEFELCTGRTHQIRVHSAYLHHPVSCDPLYGGSSLGASGQLLHSAVLSFQHPRSAEQMTFTASEPSDFAQILDRLRAKG
ncbi:MAG: RNA pseudouridine synthase, partial [Clostridiales bacterium]|nr:RNA pseudouridine synthase [Clostridiales bacterium]